MSSVVILVSFLMIIEILLVMRIGNLTLRLFLEIQYDALLIGKNKMKGDEKKCLKK